MSLQQVRVPLAWPIGTRSGFDLAKDPYIKNGMLEKYGEKLFVYKRPGTQTSVTFGEGGTTQGAFYFNGFFYVIVDDVLYLSSGSTLAGTDGSSWTTTAAPSFAAVEGMGGAVFKDRMFLIGGAPTAGTGVWSSQDGLTWAVNAGGQPWGYRSNMGVVVFQNQLWVLGGLNQSLLSTFNDVWASEDGTNWTVKVVDIHDPSMWTPRYQHCAVAANNGIYIYGGLDAIGGTNLNDVWFSADGVAWNQITDAAPWAARRAASCLYYKGEIWIIGGIGVAGTPLNDVWSSPDGATWTQRTAAAFGSGGRYSMYAFVYRDVMWIVGGSTPAASAEVYLSNSDGSTWFLDPSNMTARRNGVGLVFKTPVTVNQYQYETMWVLGGDTGFTAVNDVMYGDLNSAVQSSYALNPGTFQEPYQFTTYNNGTQLLFKNSSNFWVLSASTLTKVTDPNYPPVTVPGVVVLNAFAYVMTPSGEIHGCQLGDATIWPSLQFLTADYEDDRGICLVKYLNYVVAFGQYTTQFFYDNGANQPVGIALAPYINANLRVGADTAGPVAIVGNNVFWVTQDGNGQRTVSMFNGLSPQKVSSPYVDRILMATSTSNMVGFPAATNGHLFYVLKTGVYTALVYDTVYQEWYEWDTFGYGFYITNFNTGGDYLVSTSGGNMVNFTGLSNTDVLNGDFSLTCQTDKVDHGNLMLKFCGRVALVGDRSTATPTIQCSDDDYDTYVTLGTVDMTSPRPDLTRTGSFYRRSWKITQTDNNTARWEALEVFYEQGES